jgi:GT2 family glycosyltransferase
MNERPLFSICHTTARPHGWRRPYDLWRSRARRPETIEYVLCGDERWGFTSETFAATETDSRTKRTWNTGRKCMVDGYAAACRVATGRVLILNSDDMEPPENWDVLLSDQFSCLDPMERDFVIHVSTGWCDGPQASSIQIFSRARYERLGYAMYPGYESLFADDDFLEHAYLDGAVIDCRCLLFPHRHGEVVGDAVYEHQNRAASAELGRELLARRRSWRFGASAAPPKVFLFCPVREKAAIFAHALDAHRQLAGVSLRLYFDDNGEGSETSELLGGGDDGMSFLDLDGVVGGESGYQGHNWNTGHVARVAAIKDAAIQKFLETDADFLFFIDADVIPHPDLVRHLVSLNRPVVSEVYWSKWKDDQPWLPQVWDRHHYQFDSAENVLRLRVPGVYSVGGLGACTLIRRDVLERGACFRAVPGVDYWGEDRAFCIRAAAAGIPLSADTHYPPFHVYRDLQLDEMIRWRETGSRADYFREVWLTDEWALDVRRSLQRETRKIACCFPGETFGRMVKCYWSALEAHLIRRGFTVLPIYGEMSNPHGVRELLRGEALATGADLVLWVDDDQLLSVAQFEQLLKSLDSLPDLCFVAGWSWCDTETPVISAGTVDVDGVTPLSFSSVITAGGLLEVGYTGFPAVLMRAETLRCDPLPFSPIAAPRSRWGHTGEDVAFCQHLKARLGAAAYVDPKVFLPHLKVKALGLDGSPKSIDRACVEADAQLHGRVEVRERETVMQ